jgi:hypothetical protein
MVTMCLVHLLFLNFIAVIISVKTANSEAPHYLILSIVCCGRSQWPRGLRHELSLLARELGSWVRTSLRAWMSVCVYTVCCPVCR